MKPIGAVKPPDVDELLRIYPWVKVNNGEWRPSKDLTDDERAEVRRALHLPGGVVHFG